MYNILPQESSDGCIYGMGPDARHARVKRWKNVRLLMPSETAPQEGRAQTTRSTFTNHVGECAAGHALTRDDDPFPSVIPQPFQPSPFLRLPPTFMHP